MRLPRSTETSEFEDLIYFAAEMAIRKLMNRISGSLSSPENIDIGLLAESAPAPNNTSLNQLLALSSELNRQLEQYRHFTTIPVQPPIAVDGTSNDQRRKLTLCSLYARHLIHRPFVLYVAFQNLSPDMSRPCTPQTPQGHSPYPTPRVILEKCHICIKSCETYILNAADMLEKRTPYLFLIS